MSTIDHVTIRVADLAETTAFYERAFDLLGFTGHRQLDPFPEWCDFSIGRTDSDHQLTTGLHIAFTADSQELVESWWRGMTDAGYRSDGEPGLRPQYSRDYYGAFVLDPQGNSVEAVTHARAREQVLPPRKSGLVSWRRARCRGSPSASRRSDRPPRPPLAPRAR